ALGVGPSTPKSRGDAREPLRQAGELRGERGAHDEQAAVARELLEGGALAGEALIDALEAFARRLVDEDTGQQIGVAVAGRAVHLPVARQRLVIGKDLLDHDPW